MALSRRASELRAQGVELADLGAGEPATPSPERAVSAAIRALEGGRTKYTSLGGTPDLRAALWRHYRTLGLPPGGADGGDPDGLDLLVTVGAKAALLQAILALVGDGDEAVVASPLWVTFPEQVHLAGGVPVIVPMSAADGFALRAGPLVEAMTPRTRVVVLNSPANPTGAIMAASELAELATVCRQRRIVLISDETYERFAYPPARFASLTPHLEALGDYGLVVSSASKSFAMTGWRVGWALGSAALVAALRVVQGHATSNATTFAMAGAAAALDDGEAASAALLRLCAENRRLVIDRLADVPGLRCPEPEGSFYAFLDVRASIEGTGLDDAALAERLLERHGVLLVPGSAFGAPGFLRLSFAAATAVVEEGLAALVRGLEELAEVGSSDARASRLEAEARP